MAFTKDEEIAFRGYSDVKELFIPREGLEKTIAMLKKIDRIQKEYSVFSMSDKEALIDTKKFYNELFKLHKIMYYNIHKFLRLQYFTINKVDPFKIPVEKLKYDGDIFEGSVIEHLIPDLKPVAVFRGIILIYPFTEHTPISYAHELMHTQIDSLEGSVENFFHAELMSVFIELVITYYSSKDERLLNLEDSRRIYEISIVLESLLAYLDDKKANLVNDTDLLDNGESIERVASTYSGSEPNIEQSVRATILDDCKYLVSDLKAYDLFNTFYFGSDSIKNEMLRAIQKVLDGKITVEEYLKLFDVCDNSMQDEKRLLKYFNR